MMMSLQRQYGTTNRGLVVAAMAAIVAMGATFAVRAAILKKPKKDEHAENDNVEGDTPVEHYERAPEVYYQAKNPQDIETYDYASNPTVFGKILRGELKTRFLLESDNWVAFEDISPRAPLHALIIPKKFIKSVEELDTSHRSLLFKLHLRAHELLRQKLPQAYKQGDYKLCFHIPPLNSVDHLHLHVLAPASEMSKFGHAEFHTASPPVRWNICLEEVLKRLKAGSPATPYSRTDGLLTIVFDTLQSLATVVFASNSLTMWQGRHQALKQLLG